MECFDSGEQIGVSDGSCRGPRGKRFEFHFLFSSTITTTTVIKGRLCSCLWTYTQAHFCKHFEKFPKTRKNSKSEHHLSGGRGGMRFGKIQIQSPQPYPVVIVMS